jgi:hypothetical protein
MVNLGTAQLAGVTMVGILAIAGTNLAFAQQPCVENQAYTYVGCTPMGTAQMYGAAIVVGVAAFAVGCGAAGRQYHTIP